MASFYKKTAYNLEFLIIPSTNTLFDLRKRYLFWFTSKRFNLKQTKSLRHRNKIIYLEIT